jgi:hypothetical protein
MARARTQKGTRGQHAETNPLELLKLFLDLHEQCPGGPTDMDSASQADGVHVAAHCTGCGARLAVVLDSERTASPASSTRHPQTRRGCQILPDHGDAAIELKLTRAPSAPRASPVQLAGGSSPPVSSLGSTCANLGWFI